MLRVVYYLYKHLRIIPVRFQDISCITFCSTVFFEKGNDKNIPFKKKRKKKHILNYGDLELFEYLCMKKLAKYYVK